MRIQITNGDQRFGATPSERAAARDLAEPLPVTVKMMIHGEVGKAGQIPTRVEAHDG
jgi:hypothetical protein